MQETCPFRIGRLQGLDTKEKGPNLEPFSFVSNLDFLSSLFVIQRLLFGHVLQTGLEFGFGNRNLLFGFQLCVNLVFINQFLENKHLDKGEQQG